MASVKQPLVGIRTWLLIFIVWIAMFAAILHFFGFSDLIAVLSTVNGNWILTAIFLLAFGNILAAVNWGLLIKFLRVKIRFATVFQSMYAGFFIDDVLPNLIPGGEVAMAYLIHKRSKAPFSKTFASVVMFMVVWFIGFLLLAVLLILALLMSGELTQDLFITLLILFSLFAILLLLVLCLAIGPRAFEIKLSRIVAGAVSKIPFIMKTTTKRGLAKRLEIAFKSFHKGFRSYLQHKGLILSSCLLMLFHHLLLALSFYFSLLAFGIDISIPLGATIFLTATMISLLAMVPGELGAFEILSISALSLAASPVSAVLAVAFFRLIQYWATIFIGGFFAIKLGFGVLVGSK